MQQRISFVPPPSLGFIIVNNSFLRLRERGDVFDLALSSAWHLSQRVIVECGGNKRIPVLYRTPPTVPAIYIVTEPNLGRNMDSRISMSPAVCMRVNIPRIMSLSPSNMQYRFRKSKNETMLHFSIRDRRYTILQIGKSYLCITDNASWRRTKLITKK